MNDDPVPADVPTATAAAMLGVAPPTLRHWSERYGFPRLRPGGGRRRFVTSEVVAMRLAYDFAFGRVAECIGAAILDEADRLAHGGALPPRPGFGEPARATIVLEAAGNVIRWDDAASAMFGWPGRETIGRRIVELVIPDALQGAVLEHRDLGRAAQQSSRYLEVDSVDRRGRCFPVGVEIADPWREPGMRQLVISDLTTRRRTENLQPVMSMVRHSADPVVVYGPDERIVELNRAAEDRFGYERTVAVGLTSDLITPAPLRPDALRLLTEAREGNGYARGVIRCTRRTGPPLTAELTAVRLAPRGPGPVVATYRPLIEPPA